MLLAEISGVELLNSLREKDQISTTAGYKISFVAATQDNQFNDPNQGMVFRNFSLTISIADAGVCYAAKAVLAAAAMWDAALKIPWPYTQSGDLLLSHPVSVCFYLSGRPRNSSNTGFRVCNVRNCC